MNEGSEKTLAIGKAWRDARDRLAAAGMADPTRDAKLLAGAAFGLDGVGIAVSENEAVTPAQKERLDALVVRRAAGEPVARILGHKEFYGLDFSLNPATLVPRPETEQLVDLGRGWLETRAAPRFVDLGTGSGCIAIALLAHLPHARAVATDRSDDALAEAKANAARHGMADRLDFRQGDWFEPFAEDERFDLIVSNPPYIGSAEIEGLETDVRDYDPLLALDGGSDGLDPYRVIAAGCRAHLTPGGAVLVEHGTGQGERVIALFRAAGAETATSYRDLAGHDRVVMAQFG